MRSEDQNIEEYANTHSDKKSDSTMANEIFETSSNRKPANTLDRKHDKTIRVLDLRDTQKTLMTREGGESDEPDPKLNIPTDCQDTSALYKVIWLLNGFFQRPLYIGASRTS